MLLLAPTFQDLQYYMSKRKITTPKFDHRNPKLFYLQKTTGGPFSNFKHERPIKNTRKMDHSVIKIQRAFRAWKARKFLKIKLNEKRRIEKDLLFKNSQNKSHSSLLGKPQSKAKRRSESCEEINFNLKLKGEYYMQTPKHFLGHTLSSLWHRKTDKTSKTTVKFRTNRKTIFG